MGNIVIAVFVDGISVTYIMGTTTTLYYSILLLLPNLF